MRRNSTSKTTYKFPHMKMIMIHPHSCSKKEYKKLVKYLEKHCWDFKKVEEDGKIKFREL